MVDVHTPEQRSRNMAAIKPKDTGPERRVRSALHRLGFRFALHRDDLPGKPDIVLPKYQTAVFVHGCFWHCHDCKEGRVVSDTRPEFWATKRAATAERDRRKSKQLEELGWRVYVIWECETKRPERMQEAIQELVHKLDRSRQNRLNEHKHA